MEKYNLLSQNLRAYQKMRGLSNAEFSRELDISESSLRAVLKNGNTTLDTLIRISMSMDASLDMLVHDRKFTQKMFILKNMQDSAAWLNSFSPEQISEIAKHMVAIWEIIDT